jgi:hypothetical protein
MGATGAGAAYTGVTEAGAAYVDGEGVVFVGFAVTAGA